MAVVKTFLSLNWDLVTDFLCQQQKCSSTSRWNQVSCGFFVDTSSSILCLLSPTSVERIYATASVFGDDRVFVFGGRKAPNVLVDSAYIVQLDLSEKRIVEVSQFHFCDSTKPPSRYRHAATVVSPYHIFICGGISGSGEIFRDSWIVDVSQNKAIEVRKVSVAQRTSSGLFIVTSQVPNMPEALHSHSIVFINGQLLVSGGLSCLEDEPATGFLLFDFETQVWKKIEIPQLVPRYNAYISKEVPFNRVLVTIFPCFRYSHSSHVINNCVTLVGGCCVFDFFPGLTMVNLNAVQDVTEFQLSVISQGSYFVLKSSRRSNVFQCDRPVSTVAHQSVKCENGDILVIGGGGNLFSFGTLFSPSFRVSVPISWNSGRSKQSWSFHLLFFNWCYGGNYNFPPKSLMCSLETRKYWNLSLVWGEAANLRLLRDTNAVGRRQSSLSFRFSTLFFSFSFQNLLG